MRKDKSPIIDTYDFKNLLDMKEGSVDPELIAFLRWLAGLVSSSVTPEEFVEACDDLLDVYGNEKDAEGIRACIVWFSAVVVPPDFHERLVTLFAKKHIDNS